MTIVELLVCVAIVAVLTGILTPVLSNARLGARIVSSQTRLRQFHVVVSTYRADYGGEGSYGYAHEMGLPVRSRVSEHFFGQPLEFFISPCGQPASEPEGSIYYHYHLDDSHQHWVPEVYVFRDNMTILSDLNCNESSRSIWNEYESRRGLGLLLSGQLVKRIAPGDFAEPSWWASPDL